MPSYTSNKRSFPLNVTVQLVDLIYFIKHNYVIFTNTDNTDHASSAGMMNGIIVKCTPGPFAYFLYYTSDGMHCQHSITFGSRSVSQETKQAIYVDGLMTHM